MEFNLGVGEGGGLESRFSSIREELLSLKESLSRLEERLNELRGEIDKKLAEGKKPSSFDLGGVIPTEERGEILREAVEKIEGSQSQVDVLNHLISGLAQYVKRVALFVISGEQATGWLARGFGVSGNMPKEKRKIVIPLRGDHLVYRAVMDRVPWRGSPGDLADNKSILNMMGGVMPTEMMALPLVVKGKVGAVLYLDQGDSLEPIPSSGELEVLTKFAGLVAEVLPLRRRTGAMKEALQNRLRLTASPPRRPSPPPAEQAPPSFPPPGEEKPEFAITSETSIKPPPPRAGGAPEVGASPPSSPPFAQQVPSPPPSSPEPAFSPPTEGAQGVGVGPQPQAEPTAPPPTLTPEEQKLHEDAKRLARLLVSEIKLYNEAEVALGRKNRDLYQRLREDIERSLQVYNERVPEAVRRVKDYFKEEMIRILAGGDPSLLGI